MKERTLARLSKLWDDWGGAITANAVWIAMFWLVLHPRAHQQGYNQAERERAELAMERGEAIALESTRWITNYLDSIYGPGYSRREKERLDNHFSDPEITFDTSGPISRWTVGENEPDSFCDTVGRDE